LLTCPMGGDRTKRCKRGRVDMWRFYQQADGETPQGSTRIFGQTEEWAKNKHHRAPANVREILLLRKGIPTGRGEFV